MINLSSPIEFSAIHKEEFQEPPFTPSKAIIAFGAHRGAVLFYTGTHISLEIEDHCFYELEELGLDNAPEGLSVWEGVYTWTPGSYEYPEEGDMVPSGTFRPLTDREWELLRSWKNPLELE